MTRAFTLAAMLSSGLTLPALAGEAPATSADADPSAFAAQLAVEANAKQARNILIARGYQQVSDLTRGQGGRWTGTAIKDGKAVMVAVELPPHQRRQLDTD